MKRFVTCLFILTLLGCGPAAPAAEPAPAAAPSAGAESPPSWQPLPGLRTSGAPSREDLARARDEGITTVIDLRAPGEGSFDEAAEAAALGMHYVSLPVAGADGVTVENAHKLSDALTAADGPVLLHCASGNRAGALLAMKAFHVDGQSAEQALELGRSAGLTKLEPVVRERLTK